MSQTHTDTGALSIFWVIHLITVLYNCLFSTKMQSHLNFIVKMLHKPPAPAQRQEPCLHL